MGAGRARRRRGPARPRSSATARSGARCERLLGAVRLRGGRRRAPRARRLHGIDELALLRRRRRRRQPAAADRRRRAGSSARASSRLMRAGALYVNAGRGADHRHRRARGRAPRGPPARGARRRRPRAAAREHPLWPRRRDHHARTAPATRPAPSARPGRWRASSCAATPRASRCGTWCATGTETREATGAERPRRRASRRAGVEVVFGLPGVHNLAAWEALRESPIRLVGVRHEQAAAYAADGYARATGKLGVALVTTGPGAANTLGAVGEAWAGGAPVLVIATDIPSGVAPPRRLPRRAARVRRPARDVRAGDQGAVRRARSAGGDRRCAGPPAAPGLPRDRHRRARRGDRRRPAGDRAPWRRSRAPRPSSLRCALLDGARRPLVWAGGGAARDGARRSGRRAGRAPRAPRSSPPTRRAGVLGDHPLAVGMPPHVPEPGALWDEADLVVAIGSDLDGVNTQNWRQPQPPKLVAINVDPGDAAKNYRVDAVVHATAGAGADALARRAAAARRGSTSTPSVRPPASAWRARSRGAGVPRRLRPRRARGRRRRLRHVHPRLLDRRLPPLRRPTAAASTRWAGAPWAAPSRRRSARRSPARDRSSASRATAASSSRAASWPRWRRSACPSPRWSSTTAATGCCASTRRSTTATTYGVDLLTPDFVALARSFGVRAERVEGSRARSRDVLVARTRTSPPPTTSPRWYRRSRDRACSSPARR